MTKPNLFLHVLVALAGLVAALFPESCIKFVVIILGFASLVKGGHDIFAVRPLCDDPQFRRVVLVRGILGGVMGLVAVCLPIALFNAAATVVRVLLYVLAAWLLVYAAGAFFLTVRLNAVGAPSSFSMMECIWAALVAVALILLASVNLAGVVRVAGIAVLIVAVAFGIYGLRHPAVVVEPDSVEDAD